MSKLVKLLPAIAIVLVSVAIIVGVAVGVQNSVSPEIPDVNDPASCVHVGGTATCTEKAVCTLCGESYGEARGHNVWVNKAVAPTCTETGLTEGEECLRCGAVLKAQQTVAATGHTLYEVGSSAASCTVDGYSAHKKCENCSYTEGKTVISASHSYTSYPALDATCTVDGHTAYSKCGVCGDTAGYDVIPAGHSFETDATTGINACTGCGLIDASTIAALQAAIDAATGDTVISVSADLQGDLTITQKSDVSITIEGNGYAFNGSIIVDGKSARYDTAAATIQNLVFNADGITADACINLGNGDDSTRYTNHVTVKDCIFNGTGEEKVAIKSYTGGDHNLIIDGCTVNSGMHSLAQLTNVEIGLEIIDCKVYSKNGANLNNTVSFEMSGCEFDVKGYAVRVGVNGTVNADTKYFEISNCTLKSACADSDDAVIVFRSSATNVMLTLEDTTLEGNVEFYGNTSETKIYIIIDGEHVHTWETDATTGINACTGCGAIGVSSGASLNDTLANISAGDTLVVSSGEYTLASLKNVSGVIIEGASDGSTVIGGSSATTGFASNFGADNTFKNLTFSGTTNGVRWSYGNGGTVVFENCTFEGEATYGFHVDSTSGATFIFNNCTFIGFNAFASDLEKVVFNSCTFLSNGTYGHTNIWSIGEFNSCTWGDGATYGTRGDGVICIDGVMHVQTADQLATVVGLGYDDIWLEDGEYDVYGCANKVLTISGTENAVIKVMNDGESGCDYAFGSHGLGEVTFNGITIDTTSNTGNYKGFAYMKGTFNDCNFVGAYSLNNANDFVFNGCTFDFKNGYFWTWAANSVTFDGCIFNGYSKTILAHGGASTVININDCTFAATEKGYTGSGDHTAAVEIDPVGSNTYTINFTGKNTINDNYAGWTRVKDGSTGHVVNGLN